MSFVNIFRCDFSLTFSLELHISSGLDVLFHSLESYTAIPSVHSIICQEFLDWSWFPVITNEPLDQPTLFSAQHTKEVTP